MSNGAALGDCVIEALHIAAGAAAVQ